MQRPPVSGSSDTKGPEARPPPGHKGGSPPPALTSLPPDLLLEVSSFLAGVTDITALGHASKSLLEVILSSGRPWPRVLRCKRGLPLPSHPALSVVEHLDMGAAALEAPLKRPLPACLRSLRLPLSRLSRVLGWAAPAPPSLGGAVTAPTRRLVVYYDKASTVADLPGVGALAACLRRLHADGLTLSAPLPNVASIFCIHPPAAFHRAYKAWVEQLIRSLDGSVTITIST